MSTINSTILSILRRRRVKGLTVGEIYDRMLDVHTMPMPEYSSVRARVYELEKSGKIYRGPPRPDEYSGVPSATFTRSQ